MGKKKASKAKAEPAAVEPPPDAEMIPISSAPLPLKQLDARALGEFLELCFGDRRLLELCGELRLYSPGYRLEAMPPNQVARMLADEARAAEDAANLLEKAIREALRNPVLEGKPLADEQYRDLLELFTGDPLQHLARVAWRALIDEDEKLRAYALSAIDLGVEALDAPAKTAAPQRKPQLPADVQELRKQLEEARKTADRAGKERDSLREQLASARADIVAREKTVADVREELSQVRAELTRVSADLARLTAAGEGRALAEARRLADESRSLSERLRTAVEERDALRAQVTQAQRATAAAYLSSNPGQYAYLHFVTHGAASITRPLESAVILSPEGDAYKLYARDIVAHRLNAQLVTISACNGAGTRAYSGEGLVGLSWAFLRAGAHNVIGALWEVSDASTPQLMDAFYRELSQGKDTATALRNAKLSLLHSSDPDSVFRKPFYWAPFQIYTGS